MMLWAGFLYAEDMLDHRTYSVEVGDAGKETGVPDQFTFQNGKFESAAATVQGFEKSAYEATAVSGVITFSAAARNKKGAEKSWKGTIVAKTIEGSVVTTERVQAKNKEDEDEEKKSECWFKNLSK